MLSIVDAKPPAPAQLRSLSSSDLGVITWRVANFKERIREYVGIDPYTTRDPLEPNDDYDYSIVLDRKNLISDFAKSSKERCSTATLE
ncbi:MAG: hypothetical protein WCF14_03575 [Nitrososphaeraceae archaeon]